MGRGSQREKEKAIHTVEYRVGYERERKWVVRVCKGMSEWVQRALAGMKRVREY